MTGRQSIIAVYDDETKPLTELNSGDGGGGGISGGGGSSSFQLLMSGRSEQPKDGWIGVDFIVPGWAAAGESARLLRVVEQVRDNPCVCVCVCACVCVCV